MHKKNISKDCDNRDNNNNNNLHLYSANLYMNIFGCALQGGHLGFIATECVGGFRHGSPQVGR